MLCLVKVQDAEQPYGCVSQSVIYQDQVLHDSESSVHMIQSLVCIPQLVHVRSDVCVCVMQGVSMDSIASQRALQLGTVQSCIAEANGSRLWVPLASHGGPLPRACIPLQSRQGSPQAG